MRWNLAVAGLAGAWGLIAVIVSAVDLDATVLVWWRLSLAAVTIGAAVLLAGRRDLLALPGRRLLLAALGVNLAVHWFLYFETIKLSSVVVAVLTVYTAPIFIALLAPAVLPERRSVVGLVALAPATAGMVLIALAGEQDSAVSALALVTGVGAGATYALLVIGGKLLRSTVHPATIHFWTVVIAAAVLTPLLAAAPRVLPAGPRELGAVLLLGLVFTGVSGFVYLTLLGHVHAQAVAVLAFLEPVSASLLAWALLGEPLGPQVIAGGVLVLAAGLFVVLREPPDAAVVQAAALAEPLPADALGGRGD